MKREIRGFSIRPFAEDDSYNFDSIILKNEYRLPESMEDWMVLDIGAHIGCFAVAAYLRGASVVHCYEAELNNYNVLTSNTGRTDGCCKSFHRAVWRSDVPGGMLGYVPSENPRRSGGGNVLMTHTDIVSTQEVLSVQFDDAVSIMPRNKAGNIDLVKLDCEGSEWPILLTSNRLQRIDRIFGEFHEIGGPRMKSIKSSHGAHPRQIPHSIRIANRNGGFHEAYTQELLTEILKKVGFNVEIIATPKQEWIGKFWAVRR